MNGGVGRVARILLGVVMIYVGLATMGGTFAGYAIAFGGLLPLVMGLWGRCLLEFEFPTAKKA